MNKTDKERLKKIVKLWSELSKQLKLQNITKEKLLEDQFSQWAVTTPIYNIGEQVYNLTREFKDDHPELPWSKVAGLRHRLVHDYDDINWNIISIVVFSEMDEFVKSVEKLLSEM